MVVAFFYCWKQLLVDVIAAVAVGELLLDDGGLQARSDPADLSLEAETVVLQLGGGDDGVGGDHRAVTALTALTCHAPHPPNLQYVLPGGNLIHSYHILITGASSFS